MTTTRSVLVLLPQAGAPATLARLRATYRVSSLLEPRIAILEVNDGELARLGQEHDLSGVYPDTVPPEVLRHLRPEERLFVEAWLLQRATPKRVRPGEGLPWDAPGFQAPGPPSRGGP